MKKMTTGKPDASKTNGKTQPIKRKEQVQQSKDKRIDQDFPGFPYLPATEEVIKKRRRLLQKFSSAAASCLA